MKDIERKEGYVAVIDANPLKRLGAFFIDFNIFAISTVFILLILGSFGLISQGMITRIVALRTDIYESLALFNTLQDVLIHIGVSAYFLAYFTILESRHVWGKTPGKWLLKIEVIDEKGRTPSLKDSFLRNSTKYLLRVPVFGLPFGIVELLLIFAYSKRTGDILARTSVVSGFHKGTFTDR